MKEMSLFSFPEYLFFSVSEHVLLRYKWRKIMHSILSKQIGGHLQGEVGQILNDFGG